MNLCVIPARGGSKRIPRKNIRDFCGKPIIAWSIEAALASGSFGEVIVSTDDEEIAAVARQHGAETPFVRPQELSDDHAGTVPVIRHAIDWANGAGLAPELTCCIYATAPFVTAADLKRGEDLLHKEGCDFALTVTTFDFPIQRALRIGVDGRTAMFDPAMYAKRSQDLEEAWHDAGQFYWGRTGAWLERSDLFAGSVPVALPRHRVQDIDTEDDWTRAEWLFQATGAIARRGPNA